ncbi:hypothetical protein NBO_458g0008 [Nosema bombycis CQ1]|uniref:Uncharacterized protein n=1 Tax=Nosema bombycis (strain CQ1 / CVCC 102059) TaxID=578461 RepID=R0ME66_NOSB1|nr:hypothetical protein NBO_458g0008 [Nosema bombycis CQ1]|eukprot:EOB12365.1 hypothetical protein NBO_458g0008 [Nosema bombycis CQ1]
MSNLSVIKVCMFGLFTKLGINKKKQKQTMEFQEGIERLERKKSLIVISERSNSFIYLMSLFNKEKINTLNNGDITKKDTITLSKIVQQPITTNKVNNGNKTKKNKSTFTKIDQRPITTNKVNNEEKTIKEKITFSTINQRPITTNKVDNDEKTIKDKITLSKIDQKVITNIKVQNIDKIRKDKLNLSKIDQKVITNIKMNFRDKIRKDKVTFTKIDHFPCDQQLLEVNKVDDNLINTRIIGESNVNPHMPRTQLASMKEIFNRLSKELEALSPLDGSLVPVLNTVAKKISKKNSERMFDYNQMINFWNNV